MPKYHFEIVDEFRLEDPIGLDCTSPAQAKTLAKNIARQIAVDIVSETDRKVVVVDDKGEEVYMTSIKR